MNDTRYKNLYDALTSHIDYCNFIETYGEDNVNFENTNFDLLQTIYGAFSLTLLIDDYFVVQNNTINCKLIPNVVQQLIEKIAVYNGHGYTVGDLMYKDEYTVLEKVRNKLAHGDFIIRNGEIVFEENKLEGRIRVDKFLSFITTFETEAPQYTLSNPYTKVFNKTENLNRARKITNQKDIDYKFEIVSYNEDTCIINWQMTRTMTANNTKQEIDGIFQISLNEDGKCTYFKQWRFTR